MTYADALAFWYARINYEVRSATPADLKLERMRALFALLGDPQERVRTVHLSGTKGKGSTAALLAAVLQADGYRVGLFTSPHLVHVEERFQVNGVPITQPELAALLTHLRPAVEHLEQTPLGPPTFFEIATAVGFLHFVSSAVRTGGGGGRPRRAVRQHHRLPPARERHHQHRHRPHRPARQHAGSHRAPEGRHHQIGVPVVCGVTAPGPQAVIAREAETLAAPLIQSGRDFEFEYQPEARTVTVRTHRRYPPLPLGLARPAPGGERGGGGGGR